MGSLGQVHAISVNSNQKVCAVCSTNDAIYTCPRCAMRTCSLGCCKAHKLTYKCSGIRNVAAFVDKKDYNYFHFLSDYRFLESVDRQNEGIAEQINEVYGFVAVICLYLVCVCIIIIIFLPESPSYKESTNTPV